MKNLLLAIFLLLGFSLAACSSATPSSFIPQNGISPKTAQTKPIPENGPTSDVESNQDDRGQVVEFPEIIDSQGAVIVSVKPYNLKSSQKSLSFQVAMDTHSIDLSMNLVDLATIYTDTGLKVPALNWDAPSGGHHISGTLTFPAFLDDKPILDGAAKLTLVIKGLDVPERVFSWDLK